MVVHTPSGRSPGILRLRQDRIASSTTAALLQVEPDCVNPDRFPNAGVEQTRRIPFHVPHERPWACNIERGGRKSVSRARSLIGLADAAWAVKQRCIAVAAD
jgi:hypothetical protein